MEDLDEHKQILDGLANLYIGWCLWHEFQKHAGIRLPACLLYRCRSNVCFSFRPFDFLYQTWLAKARLDVNEVLNTKNT